MADRIELREGCAPWRPTSESELVATYRYYDMPLTGVITQHGNEYIFSCLDGESDKLSLWVYAPITAEERRQLEATPVAEFTSAFQAKPLRGCIMLAFATERLGIVDSQAVEDVEDDELLAQRMTAALRKMRERLSELSDDAGNLALSLA